MTRELGPTNADRAAWAAAALAAFLDVCPTDDEAAIGDLIFDLCHLARRLSPIACRFEAARFLAGLAVLHDQEAREDDEGVPAQVAE